MDEYLTHHRTSGLPACDDLRRARSQTSRAHVITAFVDLVAEGSAHPTTRQVADRAGVSVRLIFHYFRGLDGVAEAAAEAYAFRHRNLLCDLPQRGDAALRVAAICRQRRHYFEELTPLYEALATRPRAIGGLPAFVSADRHALRAQLEHSLAPELTRSGALAGALLDALEHATGWEAWRSLRGDGSHTPAAAERVIAVTALSLVERLAA